MHQWLHSLYLGIDPNTIVLHLGQVSATTAVVIQGNTGLCIGIYTCTSASRGSLNAVCGKTLYSFTSIVGQANLNKAGVPEKKLNRSKNRL